ncbi:MAG TPA: FtsX-like permease family protein [Burkholderiaceae bacterium]|nr:FtsX-like permease family protein [Burkholderiaceae bacterium]
MNVLRIVLAQLARRPLQTMLAIVLLALGIATLTFVILVQGQLSRQLARDARGVDLVVGAKGSPLQLILSALYHVDVPTGNVPLAALDQLRRNRLVAQVIPVSLGDNYQGFRIVGTEPALIEHYGARFAAGASWSGPMQAVIGADVARVTRLAVGGALDGTHGLAQGGAVHAEARYEVVGVLAPSGTVLDRLILTDKASVWRVHEGDPADDTERRMLEDEREVTALLVRYASPMAVAIVPRQVNAESRLMAASPANELARLFAVMGVGIDTMRVFGGVLVASSLLALFVTLYNALEERRYDIAIMRLLGASRARVGMLLLIEAWLLAAAALLAGLALGLAAVAVVGGWLEQSRAFSVSPSALTSDLLWVGIVAIVAVTLAAVIPAWRASRMDIADTLARG